MQELESDSSDDTVELASTDDDESSRWNLSPRIAQIESSKKTHFPRGADLLTPHL